MFIEFCYWFIYDIITAKDELKEAETDTPKSSFDVANDSWLDMSDSSNFKIKSKNNGKDDDGDIDLECGKQTSYVPAKGQKMAAKRLKKIQGLCLLHIFE